MSSEDKHKTGMILPVIVNWPNKIDWDSMATLTLLWATKIPTHAELIPRT